MGRRLSSYRFIIYLWYRVSDDGVWKWLAKVKPLCRNDHRNVCKEGGRVTVRPAQLPTNNKHANKQRRLG